MKLEYEFPFLVPTSPTPLAICALIQPPSQGSGVDLEHKDAFEQICELYEIAGATAEEGHQFALIGNERFELVDAPNVMVMYCQA